MVLNANKKESMASVACDNFLHWLFPPDFEVMDFRCYIYKMKCFNEHLKRLVEKNTFISLISCYSFISFFFRYLIFRFYFSLYFHLFPIIWRRYNMSFYPDTRFWHKSSVAQASMSYIIFHLILLWPLFTLISIDLSVRL